MATPFDVSELSPVKRALLEIRSLKAALRDLEHSSHQPLAIVGMALRFPGASNPDAFWQLLAEGRSAISEIPRDRWDIDRYYDTDPAAPGKMYVRKGGFLERVDEFDAGFFGIHPREAVAMDPQQRLLLEVAWEALENAAQSPAALAESATGVYLGMAGSDYLRLLLEDADRIDTYTATGGSTSLAAGRLSYLLGLQGPSLVLDTSCSSSLVAVHLACRSLRARECRMALAGGVNLIQSPESTIALCKSRMLAPDGRCKTFDDSADGYVRAEGCGVVVIKRLADAVQDGDYVHAVIRGSAVNQDGRSGGLTVPSGPAQERVIRSALSDARVDAADIDYVEAHGTGTSLGDPIEVHALISALCGGRPADRPLYLGSAKTNIGHMEAAAGIAGLIKTVLAMQHDCIPAHLHLEKLNSHIDLQGAPIRIPTSDTPWGSDGRPRIAGVSSFGFSGTNAHVILEEAPRAQLPLPLPAGPQVLMLSARSPQALAEMARRYGAWFEAHPELSPADVCFTAGTCRKIFDYRAAFTGASLEELRQGLEVFAPDGACDSWPAAPPLVEGRRVPLPTYPFERSRYWIDRAHSEPLTMAAEACQTQASRIPADLDVASYEEMYRCLESITTASITEALFELGAPLRPGERLTLESLIETTGALASHGRLLYRWLKHLADQGLCLSEPDGVFLPLDVPAGRGREELLAQAAAKFPKDEAILEYVASCGRQLAAILRGKQSPLETLFPNGDDSLAERLYQSSQASRYHNSIVAAAVSAVSGMPARRRAGSKVCRILEVGAGTGATTASVLPLLSASSAEYHFTDLSNLFLSRARRKFEAYPFVRYGLLDIERDPADQGYETGSFDVVLGTNVLHATRDLPRALAQIASLLAPGGLLVLCEATQYVPWFDITTALIEGWQLYDDGVRTETPLLSVRQWLDTLSAAGYTGLRAFPEDGSATEVLGQNVIIAVAPSHAAGESLAFAGGAVAVAGSSTNRDRSTNRGTDGFRAVLNNASPAGRRPLLVEFIREQLAAVLGISLGIAPAGALSPAQRLMDLGLDSLMAIEVRDVLERGLHLKGRLSSTLIFDFPTIEALARHLECEIFGAEPEPATEAPLPSRSEPLAIIGAACRLPGGVEDLDSFWTLLTAGTDAVREIPRDRWRIADWYDPDPDKPGKMATKWGGFIRDIDQFDPEFFGISPREAESMDPQQRLLLEVSWEALENAAQHPGELGKSRTGVFVGLVNDDYSRLLSRDGSASEADAYYASGVARSVAAGRISYVLGLQGPNLSIDTACSSSLVAVHQACQSLRSGECRMALAGGANVILLPETTVALSRAKMMAADGRCKAFDDSADGFVRAEGCVMLVLKRLCDALEDRDGILAVIRGSAINQDGRSSGLTVPNGPAQEAVIRQALADAGVAPSAVSYVETHGTGTSLGDPIEAHALVAALGEGRSSGNPLHIGSVKTNLGHLESASGAAGLLKTALALSHGEIPANLHFKRWNRNIDLKGMAIEVPVELTPWRADGRSRIAGVSSFGFSGTNAHLILEEAPARAAAKTGTGGEVLRGEEVLRISGRSEAALRRLAERYCGYLERHPEVSLAGVCATARACRMAFPWKLEVTASSVLEMRTALSAASAEGRFTHDPAAGQENAAPPQQKIALPLTPFERHRYWRRGSHAGAGGHPLLGRRISSPALSQIVFEASVRAWPDFLTEHRVLGKAVLPMAAFLEIFLAASGATALEDVLVQRPLELDADDTVQIVVGAERVELYQRDGGDWKLCGSARMAKPGQPPGPADLAELLARSPRTIAPSEHYRFLRLHGVELGTTFQLVRELRAGAGHALGCITIPEDSGAYQAHPALIDAWIQVLGAAVPQSQELYVPVGIERFELLERPAGELWSFATVRPGGGDTLTADIQVLNNGGRVVARFEALRLRRRAPRHEDGVLFELAWRSADRTGAVDTARLTGNWLIFADAGGVGAGLVTSLEGLGAGCKIVPRGESFEQLLSDSQLTAIVYLWGLDAPLADDISSAALGLVEREVCGPVLEIVRTLDKRSHAAPGLFLVTRGAQTPVAEDGAAVLQAPLWGLARTIRLEHPELRCVSVDLDPRRDAGVEQLSREIRQPDGEVQVAWRRNSRLAARLVRVEGDCDRVDIANRGSLEHLKLGRTARRAPAPGEVEIRVAAAALNFRDVLNALGEYPGDPGPLGGECAGEVAAVGEGVTEFAAGDAVVAVAKGALSTYVNADTALVARKPARLSMEEAASIPIAYLTARYALHHVGHLAAGDRVLIHAAAGGVGLAAVAEAQRAGAEIFATAGAEDKRTYLRSLGIVHVLNSRTLEYGAEIMARTQGRGVNVLLNSLGGEFAAENLRLLAPGGRYLELGKKGWDASRVAAERPDVHYFAIDWGEEYQREPHAIASLYQQLFRDAHSGQVQALPSERFAMTNAAGAFRRMAAARHIGKIILMPQSVRSDATYLITGGLGGLGLRVAEWLVERGARHLALAGRSKPGLEAQRAIRNMEDRGAQIAVHSADVSLRADIQAVFQQIALLGPPLGGIVHAAGVLENAVLSKQDWGKFARVLAPKVQGAWHLHELSRGLNLDFFVSFSSLASLLGAPGQANHAAANSFLDALAAYRRSKGMAAVSINWGPWSDIGAASSDKSASHLAGRGIGFLTPEQGLAVFESALNSGRANFAAARISWREAQQALGIDPAYLSGIATTALEPAPATPAAEISNLLEHADPAGRHATLVDEVRRRACRVLGLHAGHAIDEERALSDLGLDSLMAVELRNSLSVAIGKPLPSTLIFSYPSTRALAEYLATQVLDLDSEIAEPDEAAVPHLGDFLSRLEQLSEDEVSRMLNQAAERIS